MNNLEQKLEKIVEKGLLELPVLPAVGVEVLELTRNENSDAKSLAALIQNDQSLAGHVMKVANSAAYNAIGKIQTLQQAIAKLGMQQIGQMALAVTVGRSAFKSDPVSQKITAELWKRSLACAAWAREIARIGRINTEVVFLSGLLHQIGKPVVLHAIVGLLDSDDDFPSQDELLSMIDNYQKIIGLNLARKWNLPESVIETIEYIDDFDAAPHAREEVAAVNAARHLVDLTLDTTPESYRSITELDQPVFTELNLYEEDLQLLEDKRELIDQLLQTLVL